MENELQYLKKYCKQHGISPGTLMLVYQDGLDKIKKLTEGFGHGVLAIEEERKRQVEVEKWDYKHDEDYKNGELIGAAACYTANALKKSGHRARAQIYLGAESNFLSGNTGDRGDRQLRKAGWQDAWPWDDKWDKRDKHDKRRSLVIAGALIAAEIDRMYHAE